MNKLSSEVIFVLDFHIKLIENNLIFMIVSDKAQERKITPYFKNCDLYSFITKTLFR